MASLYSMDGEELCCGPTCSLVRRGSVFRRDGRRPSSSACCSRGPSLDRRAWHAGGTGALNEAEVVQNRQKANGQVSTKTRLGAASRADL